MRVVDDDGQQTDDGRITMTKAYPARLIHPGYMFSPEIDFNIILRLLVLTPLVCLTPTCIWYMYHVYRECAH